MGLSQDSTSELKEGGREGGRDRVIGLGHQTVPSPQSESLGDWGGSVLAVGELYVVNPQAGGVIWD